MAEEIRNAPYFIGEDRISSLQDDLIHHILSFIDTKYVVQTSVLSKRWIDIWKSMRFLNFDRDSFSEDRQDSFIMFVDMVLFFRKDCDIQKFKLQWMNSVYDTSVVMNVTRWSLGAVKYNVKEFWLVITQCHDSESAYEIPHRLLNCKSLGRLVIGIVGDAEYADIILPSSMSLPQLKTLFFFGLSANVESFKRLFSSCPVLKRVRLVNCNIQTNDQRNLTVESLSLKTFAYIDSSSIHLLPQNDITADIVKLCAPNLEVFTCKSFLSRDYSLEIRCPLSGVNFDMKLKAETEDENVEAYSKLPSTEKAVYARRMMKLLGAVYMVKEMRLSPGFLEVLSLAPDLPDCRPPHLLNLKWLALEMWCTRGCLRAIAYLLSISPKVTKIFLESKESKLANIEDGWDAGLSLPEMLPCLEFVQIKEVEGCDNELKFLSFLLKKSTNLKKVVLYPRSTIKSPKAKRLKRKFRDKLRALPRASSRIRMEWPATKSIRI